MLKLIVAALLLLPQFAQAQKLEQIVAEAKKEGEVTLMASTSTFGGKKGFAELEALFAKRYGFKAKLNLSGGPSFPQMAARIITEQKAGTKSSTDLYLGSDGTYMTMHLEKALQKVNWSGTFPWVTKEMEIFPQESVLVCVVSRHHLQFQRDPERQGAEKLRRPDRSRAIADVGGQDGDPRVYSLADPSVADMGQGEDVIVRA